MKKLLSIISAAPITAFLILFVLSVPYAGQSTTLIGEVNDDYQLVESTTGQLYEVAQTKAGDELVTNHVSQKVRVTGTIREKDGIKIITVETFEVMDE